MGSGTAEGFQELGIYTPLHSTHISIHAGGKKEKRNYSIFLANWRL
jgi:hypothetical protein